MAVPCAVKTDPQSFEIIRVWVTSRGQHFIVRIRDWPDPAAWGLLLADLAKHVASSNEKDAGVDRQKVLDRIKAGLDLELS